MNLLCRFSQTLSQTFLESVLSTAQDTKGDRTQLSLRHPRVAVGAALEQHLSSGEEIIPNFFISIYVTTILIRSHLIKISTSRFKLFTVKL